MNRLVLARFLNRRTRIITIRTKDTAVFLFRPDGAFTLLALPEELA